MIKQFSLIVITLLLVACGGGSGGESTASVSKELEKKITLPFSIGNKPAQRFKNGYELFPTMTVTVDFVNNFGIDKINDLFFNIHMSADSSPNYEGQEFAYFFENGKAYYRWVYSKVGNGTYCCTDYTDTYYEVSNLNGHVQLRLFHYGMHTRTTWSALKEKIHFQVSAESKMLNNVNKKEALSTDFFPEKGVFTTDGYEFIDSPNDYIGNNNLADIASVKVELNFNHFKKIDE